MTALTGIRIFLLLAVFISIYCKEKTYLAKLGKKNHGEKVSLITTIHHGQKHKNMKKLTKGLKGERHKDKHQPLLDDDYSITIGSLNGGGLGGGAINAPKNSKVINGKNDHSWNNINIFPGGQDLATLLALANTNPFPGPGPGPGPGPWPATWPPVVNPITPRTSTPAYCSNHESLTFGDRNVKNNKKYYIRCDHTDAHLLNRPTNSQPDWKGGNWYRFTGAAGSQMLSSPVARPNCGTSIPGYLTGGHPSPGDGEVSRTVQFVGNGPLSPSTVRIRVFNCGGFYVYKLPNTPSCFYGYCGTD